MQSQSDPDEDRRMKDIDREVIIGHEFCEFALRIVVLPEEYYESEANANAEERFPQGISCTLPVVAALELIEITGDSATEDHDRQP